MTADKKEEMVEYILGVLDEEVGVNQNLNSKQLYEEPIISIVDTDDSLEITGCIVVLSDTIDELSDGAVTDETIKEVLEDNIQDVTIEDIVTVIENAKAS